MSVLMRIVRRVGGMVLVVWLAATAAFAILAFIPGDPVEVMLGTQAQASDELKASIRAELGLDRPLLEQYVSYLAGLLRGDLGTSYQLKIPVVEAIAQQAGHTIQLTSAALALAIVITLISAIFVRGRRARSVASFVELLAISSPPFWTGLLLLAFFSFTLGWFPVAGADGFTALVLPAITIALPITGLFSQVMRAGIETAEQAPFVLSARARGASPTRVNRVHTVRHGALPALTLAGYLVGTLMGGAVIVETVFGRPGLGRVALNAIIGRDLPLVMGLIVVLSIVFVIVGLVVDLLAERLDPRMIVGGRAALPGARRDLIPTGEPA